MALKLAACVLLVALGCASADEPKSAAASPVQYTPQEMFLAKQAYGNFACHVNTVSVSTENPGTAESPVVSKQDVLNAFQNVANLEWSHVAQASFSSFDGRNEEKILSTPGGDMGEFIQAMAAYAKVSSKSLTQEDVLRFFERYLKTMTRSKFFYETDEKAYIRLAVATGCKNLHVADMGGMKHKKEEYVKKIAIAEHIGDPFIRFLATNFTELEFPLEAIQHSLAAYHQVLWTTPSQLSSKLCYLQMSGAQGKEQALVHLRTAPFCTDQGLAPMVSSQLACPAPVFINHADAVKLFRRELVASISAGEENLDAREFMAAFNQIAEKNLEKFWNQVGAGLPVYTVTFSNSSPLLSEDVSFTP